MTLTLETRRADEAVRAFVAGRRLIEEAEACLSRFRPTSELCRLNTRAGAWTDVSPLLGQVIGVALAAAEASDGRCVPTVLGALEAAGYDRDFDALAESGVARSGVADVAEPEAPPALTSAPLRSHPHSAERASTCRPRGPALVSRRRLRLASSGLASLRLWRAIRFDPVRSRVWLPPGCRLDLAGVAKGWTADRVADLLARTGPCLVDAGGDIAARGAPLGLSGWPVSVVNPCAPDDDLALLLLRDEGLATSGTDHRRWTVNGRPRHHLIDPRSGRSARTDVLTASVVAPTVAEADVLAKVAVLRGARRALADLTREHRAGLIVRRDGRTAATPRWRSHAIVN